SGVNAGNTAFVDALRLVALAGIADPDFEIPALAPGTFAYAPAGSSWSFAGTAGLAANGSGFTAGQPPAPSRRPGLFLQDFGSASQPIDLAAGTYAVSFRAADRANFPSSQTYSVLFDGTVVGAFGGLTGTAYGLQVTGRFTAEAGMHTLTFRGTNLNGGENTIFIDQVALLALTPAPADPRLQTPPHPAHGLPHPPTPPPPPLP